MPAFFSSNNKILNAFGRIADVVYLSFIWLLFSIPLITIGASTTALYYTVNKVIRNQRGHVLREFWRSFRSGFLQSTILWLGFLALLFFLRADLKALEYLGYDNKILLYIVQGVAIFATLVLVYALCYVARFTQKLGALLLFTLVMLFSNLPQTLLLLLVCALAALMVYTSPLLLIITPGVFGLLANIVLEKVFVKYMTPEDRDMEEKLNKLDDD